MNARHLDQAEISVETDGKPGQTFAKLVLCGNKGIYLFMYANLAHGCYMRCYIICCFDEIGRMGR